MKREKILDTDQSRYLRVKSLVHERDFVGLRMEPMLFNNYMIMRDSKLVGTAMAADIAKFMFKVERCDNV